MKILIDENLPSRLPRRLRDLFPSMQHARDLGFAGASDQALWSFARNNEYACILTADGDFQNKALDLGYPPKVIRIDRCDFSSTLPLLVLRR